MSVAVGKIPGVTGVKVEINLGLAEITLARVNGVGLRQIRKAIRAQGFNPRQALLSATGKLRQEDGHWVFQVSGSAEDLRVTGPVPRAWAELAGKPVLMHGEAPAPGRDGPTVHIFSIGP